jgi:wyosine [tRNA(Phe)-imidazoG37] synthetase (radical SAM superfamily)
MSILRTGVSRLLSPGMRRAAIWTEVGMLERLRGGRLGALVHPWLVRRYRRRPQEIDIEVTSSCDADCIMCPRRSMRRAQGPMALPLFEAIVDEAIALGVRDLVLNGYGEIATLRNYRDYLAYIRRRSRTVRVLVNTNGMRLTEDFAAALIEYGVDIVNIAIDGATAETYESIRRHLKLDVVEANVKRLVDMRNASGKKRPYIMLNMIHMAENAHEASAFLEKWKGIPDYVGLAGVVSRGGSIAVPKPDADWAKAPCFLLWRQMPILSDGTVAMCCDDWNGTSALGNVAHGGIKAIWQSPAHERFRALHLAGRAAELDLCQGCQSPRLPPWWFQKTA